MGLKCQLLGHAYGSPEVERSREEQGDEVVVTVRNVKVCERCGDEQMVNQTKEVTSVRSPDEVGLDTSESPPTADPAEQPAGDTPEPAAGEPDAPESPVTPVEPEAAGSATPEPEPSPETGSGTSIEAGVDDTDEPAVEPAADRIDDDMVADATVSAPADDDTALADDPDDPDGESDDVTDAVDDTDVSPEADDGWETGSDDWDDVDPDIDDAVILDAEETHQDEVQWPEESAAAPDDGEESEAEWVGQTAESGDPEPDPEDAEIIDAGGDEADAGWPTHDDEAGSWPDHDGTDEGYSAAPNADVETEFDGEGLTPEVNGSATADSTGVDGVAVRASNGHAAGESGAAAADTVSTEADAEDEGFVRAAESASSESDVPDGQVEFYCPNCGYAQAAGVSSMRAGDICPECKRGYIAEREA